VLEVFSHNMDPIDLDLRIGPRHKAPCKIDPFLTRYYRRTTGHIGLHFHKFFILIYRNMGQFTEIAYPVRYAGDHWSKSRKSPFKHM